MTIQQAINNAKALTGQVVDDATLVRWLSELDGRLAFEFYRADVWTPYDPVNDLAAELLVPFPWDGLYVHHLEAMTYFSDAEYDRYENARALGEKTLADFRAFMQRTSAKTCGGGFPTEKTGGTGTTIIPALTESPWFWISAYSIAVKHGYSGTEAEFAAMMEEANDTANEALAAVRQAHPPLVVNKTDDAETTFNAIVAALQLERPVFCKSGDYYYPLVYAGLSNSTFKVIRFCALDAFAPTYAASRYIELIYNENASPKYHWQQNVGVIELQKRIIPDVPNGAGTYVLKATRASAGATPTYAWVAE